jgi:hypothetical protein
MPARSPHLGGQITAHIDMLNLVPYRLSQLIRSTPASGARHKHPLTTDRKLTSSPLKFPTQQTPKFVLTTMSNLFSPLKLGPIKLSHRIAMAPFTRFRADSHHQVNDLVKPPSHAPLSIPLHHHPTDTPQNTTSNPPPRAVSSSAKQPKNSDGCQKGPANKPGRKRGYSEI